MPNLTEKSTPTRESMIRGRIMLCGKSVTL